MEEKPEIDRNKVRDEFDDRAARHGNMNAVLDAGVGRKVAHQNIFRDYITKKSLKSALKLSPLDVVLDFGCGIGRLSAFLSPFCRQLEGLDVSAAMVQLAREQNSFPNTRYQALQSTDLPFDRDFFHKAFTVWVLQHIGDEEVTVILREFFRVMVPGGTLVLLEQVRSNRQVFSGIHIQRTREEYAGLMREAGFMLQSAKEVFRKPSYALSLWNKYPFLPGFLLPLLGWIESATLHRKPQFAEYYTVAFVAEKPGRQPGA